MFCAKPLSRKVLWIRSNRKSELKFSRLLTLITPKANPNYHRRIYWSMSSSGNIWSTINITIQLRSWSPRLASHRRPHLTATTWNEDCKSVEVSRQAPDKFHFCMVSIFNLNLNDSLFILYRIGKRPSENRPTRPKPNVKPKIQKICEIIMCENP